MWPPLLSILARSSEISGLWSRVRKRVVAIAGEDSEPQPRAARESPRCATVSVEPHRKAVTEVHAQ